MSEAQNKNAAESSNIDPIERRGGTLLFVVLPIIVFFYIFSPEKALQFISLFLLVLFMGAKVYSLYLLRHLNLVRMDKELRVFRHEWANVEIWIENKGLLPAFLMIVGDTTGMVPVFRNVKCLCTLGPKRRRLFRWEALGSARGVYTIGPAILRGSDPLGLFPFTINCGEKTTLYVYPTPAFTNLKSPGGIPLGNLLTNDLFNEDLTRYRSLREYRSGDESRRINWKASARNNKLLVNEYDLSLSYPLVLFLNVDVNEYTIRNREAYVERIIETAAAICLMAARDRQVLGLIVHTAARDEDDVSLISPAASTLIPVLERLAALEPFKIVSGTETSSTGSNDAEDIEEEKQLRHSTLFLLEKGKTLGFGTRLIYAGPALPEEDFFALESLKRQRLSMEFYMIDETSLTLRVGSGRYQIKERGYELL